MEASPINLVEEQIDTKRYTPFNTCDLPKIILGFNIKNKYDEDRLQIRPMFNPRNILHHYGVDSRLTPIYFHGIELEPRSKVSHLCSVIKNASPITVESYQNILKYNRLKCDTCYSHLRDGVYPIDITCLQKLSRNRYKSCYLYLRSLLESNEELPWFASWSSFNVFMLCPSIIHSKHNK